MRRDGADFGFPDNFCPVTLGYDQTLKVEIDRRAVVVILDGVEIFRVDQARLVELMRAGKKIEVHALCTDLVDDEELGR